ncbi:MAG: hypothetical protein JNM55_05005 [Anaerolineales bacterium]|nr:hypothetical protein [Anaerolineales bacterium]
MSDLNFKSEDEKSKIIAETKTNHTIVSIIYIGIIVLMSPFILWSLVYGYGLLNAVFWVIGSIIVSRILININNKIAYIVLFSAPIVASLFFIWD